MRRWSLGALGLAAGLTLLTGPASAAAPARAGQLAAAATSAEVVVIGVPGLRWDHVEPAGMPALSRLADAGARGSLSTRTATEVSCPDAAWLTLAAGGRARGDSGCADPEVSAFLELRARNGDNPDRTRIGSLAEVLTDAGECISATGPGAELVALTPDGRSVDGSDCRLRVLGLPPVRTDDDVEVADRAIAAALADVDARTRWLVLGVGESSARSEAHLHVAVAGGPDLTSGAALRSASTGRAPYVQLIDVAPTLLGWLGLEAPAAMAGRPISARGHISVERLADLDVRARGQRAVVFPFTAALVACLLLLVLAAIRRPRSEAVRSAAVALLAVPAASFLAQLVPWWRAPVPVLGLLVASAVIAGSLASTARVLSRVASPATLLCAVTAAVLAADVAGRSRLQMDAVFGYSPYVAGRFHGFGNPAFALFGTAALLAAVAAGRRWGPRAVLVVGALAVVVDGLPLMGDDFGGVLALVPAFAVLASLLATGRVGWRRLLAAGAAAAVVVTGFALADYSRSPAQRTHLGRFVEQVREGTASDVVTRKAQANLDLLLHSPFTMLVPLLVLAGAFLLLRPPARLRAAFRARPAAHAGLLAVLTLSLVGGLANDSGVAVPALALLLAVPYGVLALAGPPGPVSPRVSALTPPTA